MIRRGLWMMPKHRLHRKVRRRGRWPLLRLKRLRRLPRAPAPQWRLGHGERSGGGAGRGSGGRIDEHEAVARVAVARQVQVAHEELKPQKPKGKPLGLELPFATARGENQSCGEGVQPVGPVQQPPPAARREGGAHAAAPARDATRPAGPAAQVPSRILPGAGLLA
jgi:hypothetical protein